MDKSTEQLGILDYDTVNKIKSEYAILSSYLTQEKIISIQEKLNVLKYYININRYFDQLTQNAVKYF